MWEEYNWLEIDKNFLIKKNVEKELLTVNKVLGMLDKLYMDGNITLDELQRYYLERR
ncbi:MAG: hypothetical protein NTX05_07345 [Fusobacteria bacterium]|nr:hypothetical protein [Fusobacteriota bacterium]